MAESLGSGGCGRESLGIRGCGRESLGMRSVAKGCDRAPGYKGVWQRAWGVWPGYEASSLQAEVIWRSNLSFSEAHVFRASLLYGLLWELHVIMRSCIPLFCFTFQTLYFIQG